ncbi:hypothetical protein BGX31_007909 [Mortierella sp. GBA43]|nr:hypothetical protein BGX31_007909 [Mortierella sp. GBA43]
MKAAKETNSTTGPGPKLPEFPKCAELTISEAAVKQADQKTPVEDATREPMDVDEVEHKIDTDGEIVVMDSFWRS